MENAEMMKTAIEEGFPLRQGAGTGLDWFSVATEASGGGTPDLFWRRDSPGPTPILRGLLLVQK